MKLQMVQALTIMRNFLNKKLLLIDNIFFSSKVRYVVIFPFKINENLGHYELMNFVMGG